MVLMQYCNRAVDYLRKKTVLQPSDLGIPSVRHNSNVP